MTNSISRPALQSAFIVPPGNHPPLFIPRRSRDVPAVEWSEAPGPILDAWREIAQDKGFRIDRRVRDRYHLALECDVCGAQTAQKIFTLRTAAVACAACADARRRRAAKTSGLHFVDYDQTDRHYAFYKAPCGHTLRRQFELIARASEGSVDLRCETCLEAREEQEAKERGWERLGRDSTGDPNYRLYRHTCGHEQRIARANMQSGHLDCAECGESWSARPSFIYLLDIRRGHDHFIKLGYSNDPVRRHRHQLAIPKDTKVAVLRQIDMPSGSLACSREKRLHNILTQSMPKSVVPRTEFKHLINTTCEVYRPWARPRIELLLDALEAELSEQTRARA